MSKATIRLLDARDARFLENVVDGVFDHPVDPALAAEFLADPRHHLAVALGGAALPSVMYGFELGGVDAGDGS